MGIGKQTIAEEIATRYERSFETLARRCVAEPYSFHRVAPMLSPGMFKDGLQSGKVVAACALQYSKGGNYTPQSISLATGLDPSQVLEMGREDSETDLGSAMESFLLYYGQWVEVKISEMVLSWIMAGKTSEEIIVESDRERRARGVFSRLNSSDGKAEFEAKLLAALDGIVFSYPVSPFLQSMRNMVKYYKPGDYIVVAALSGVGKSFYALNQMHYLAKDNVPSLYINLENTPMDVQNRLWQMECGESFKDDMRGSDAETRKRIDNWEAVKKMPIGQTNPGRSLSAVISAIRQDWHERGTQFVAIDYVQQIGIPGYKSGRNYELGEVSTELRLLSLELNIPIMAFAQMKQEVSKTSEKRGGMYDIRDCANFAQDATFVQCLYRPSYWNITQREMPNGGYELYPEKHADIFNAKGRETGAALSDCSFDHIKGFYDVEFNTSPFDYPPPVDFSTARPDIRNDKDTPF